MTVHDISLLPCECSKCPDRHSWEYPSGGGVRQCIFCGVDESNDIPTTITPTLVWAGTQEEYQFNQIMAILKRIEAKLQ